MFSCIFFKVIPPVTDFCRCKKGCSAAADAAAAAAAEALSEAAAEKLERSKGPAADADDGVTAVGAASLVLLVVPPLLVLSSDGDDDDISGGGGGGGGMCGEPYSPAARSNGLATELALAGSNNGW